MSFPSAVSTASAVWKKCIRVSFFFLHFLILKTFAKTLWLAFPSFSLISSFARQSLWFNLFEQEKGKYYIFLKVRLRIIFHSGSWTVGPPSFLSQDIYHSWREDEEGRSGLHLRVPKRLELIDISNLRTKINQETIMEKRKLLFIQTFWKYEGYNDRIYYNWRNKLNEQNPDKVVSSISNKKHQCQLTFLPTLYDFYPLLLL